MEVLIGIQGKDFVLVASDALVITSIVAMKHNQNKTRKLNNNVLLMFSGEGGDSVQFCEFIQRNVQLNGIRRGYPLSTKAAANFTRIELADSLRSRNPYQVNLLIAGCDPETGVPELYWLDYLASLKKLPFAVQGYGQYFCNSTMDRYYHPDMTLEEAKVLMKKCINELKVRFIINFTDFVYQVVDKEGIKEIKIE